MHQLSLFVSLIAFACAPLTTAVAQVGNNAGILNPNQASGEALAALPHLNEELSASIVDARPFLSQAALNAHLSASLSAEQLEELYGKLFVPLNLNTAYSEEIQMIPGVGNRMTHEFEEYRPYRAMPQFRREIGKYVDDAEVARLEQYVFVPINLNTATDEDILTIPGLGNRMLHEFKEYRPYENIDRFRREIGKYVDESEVARLERYVTIQ